jgi:hypothetical protein
MKTFSEWLAETTIGTEDVDISPLESVPVSEIGLQKKFDVAKLAVALVRAYDQNLQSPLPNTGGKEKTPNELLNEKLLTYISTIANLSSGAYGVFIGKESKKVLASDIINQIKKDYPNDPTAFKKLSELPKHLLLKYLPGIDNSKIIPSDVIHVNISRHIKELGLTYQAIIEIASTIVHEATHVLEKEETGQTNDGPNSLVKKAEEKFMNWVNQNKTLIFQMFKKFGAEELIKT